MSRIIFIFIFAVRLEFPDGRLRHVVHFLNIFLFIFFL